MDDNVAARPPGRGVEQHIHKKSKSAMFTTEEKHTYIILNATTNHKSYSYTNFGLHPSDNCTRVLP